MHANSRRHTIAEARDSVDRLNAIVEKYYKEMSSRVQALEFLHTQKDDASWVPEDEAESLATIRAPRPDLSSEDMSSGLEYFDFSDELQRSRVYRRNQAFRRSVISALTNSVCSLGWSFFSELSMAEVSNISVINLAVTKGEVFNPGRSLQTWSAQPNSGVSSDDYVDGQCTQLYELTDRPVQRSASLANVGESRPASTQMQRRSLPGTRSPSPRSQPLERRNTYPQWRERFGDKKSTINAGNLSPTSTISSADPSDLLSPTQVRANSSPQSHEWVYDKEPYRCKGCGEVCSTPSCYLSAEAGPSCLPSLGLDRSANDCNLHLDSPGRKGLRTRYVFIATKRVLCDLNILTIYQRETNGILTVSVVTPAGPISIRMQIFFYLPTALLFVTIVHIAAASVTKKSRT